MDTQTPRYSIIIPAYNEEFFLPATLESVRHAMSLLPDLQGEIIVVDNHSTDNTAEEAKAGGARVVYEDRNCISSARNKGAAEAHSDNLIFLDADTHIPPALLRESVALLLSSKVYGGGSKFVFDSQIPLPARLSLWVWRNSAPKLGLAAGSYIFCKRDIFKAAGGFNEEIFAGEEIWFCRRARKIGRKQKLKFVTISDFPAITSARKFTWYSAGQISAMLALLTLCPILFRSKKFCNLWYARPKV